MPRSHDLHASLLLLVLVGTLLSPAASFAGPPDGNPDVVFGGGPGTVCQGDGAGGFICSNLANAPGRIDDVTIAELNGDGRSDILFANGANNPSTVCLSDGLGNLGCAPAVSSQVLTAGTIGDIDNDGDSDLVFAHKSNASSNQFCLNDGSGTFGPASCTTFVTLNRGTAVGIADMNGDNIPDAVFSSRFGDSHVCLNDGTPSFTCTAMIGVNGNDFGLSVGDLDADGDVDAVLHGNQAQICTNDGAGLLTCVDLLPAIGSAGIADFNGDSHADILLSESGGLFTCLGDGTGTVAGFTCTQDTSDPFASSDMDLGDVNGDGHLDAAFFVNSGNNRVCLGDGVGAFTCSTVDDSGGNGGPSGVAIGDVSGPGVPTLSIADNIPGAELETVDVDVALATVGFGIAATSFSVDYDEACLAFDETDTDADNIPDAVTFNGAADFAVTVFHDLGDSDGEIDISIADVAPPIATLADGALVTITFTATCSPALRTTIRAPVGFSDDPSATFSTDLALDIPGLTTDGAVEIFPGPRGDCNSTGALSAADLIAGTLDIFDDDGSFWADAAGSTFAGSPVGCDANDDTAINAGDISCISLLIFGGSCGGSGGITGATAGTFDPATSPVLGFGRMRRDAEGQVWFPVTFSAGAHAVSSTAFSIDLADRGLTFDAFDGDGDQLPDGVRFPQGRPDLAEVRFNPNDRDGELDIVLAEIDGTLPDGVLIEIAVRQQPRVAPLRGALRNALRFARTPAASFGDATGRAVVGETVDRRTRE